MTEYKDQSLARARAFFKKASALAGTGNYDYAIDMYLQGLDYAPEALKEGHLPLFEMALHRKGLGGKGPTISEKVKRLRGKTPQEQMLNAEYLFVKDPDHLPYAEAMLKAAVAGGYNRVADWIANLIFQMNNAVDKPSLHTFLLLKDCYLALGKMDKAHLASQHALKLKPEDKELSEEFKNLSAELTMQRGNYETANDFRDSIKDRELQERLQAQESVVKSENYKEKAVEYARAKLAQQPNVNANIFELANALADLEQEQAENEAISLLESSYKNKSDFSFKQRAGQIKLQQLRRQIRQIKAILEQKPDDGQVKENLEKLSTELDQTELEHYHLCMVNYPTDLHMKYEYALRLVRFERYDEAIPLFQEAQKDPRRKLTSMNQVGYSFFKKGWLEDAVDVFNQALEMHSIKDDAIGKELRYNLARSYEEKGDMQKSLEIYRKIAQEDFSYKDVSQRIDKLRKQSTETTSQ